MGLVNDDGQLLTLDSFPSTLPGHMHSPCEFSEAPDRVESGFSFRRSSVASGAQSSRVVQGLDPGTTAASTPVARSPRPGSSAMLHKGALNSGPLPPDSPTSRASRASTVVPPTTLLASYSRGTPRAAPWLSRCMRM